MRKSGKKEGREGGREGGREDGGRKGERGRAEGMILIFILFYPTNSETTANNMRKKGKPNPDQKLVV